MKRRDLASLAQVTMTALVGAAAVGYFVVSAFRQGDCDGSCDVGTLLVWVLAVACGWMVLGGLAWWRSDRTRRSVWSLCAALLALSAVASAALYAYRLQQAGSGAARLRANQDDSHVLVAVRTVPTLGIATGQRCIFSSVDCEARPPRITAVCEERGSLVIEEPNWGAFERRPQEDFGVPPTRAVSDFPQSCRPAP